MDTLNIANELHTISQTLIELSNTIGKKSFWESNVFSAIIGAASAIIITAVISINHWLKNKRRVELKETIWFAENYVFYKPIDLWKKASHTAYGGKLHDGFTGETESIPDKTINEKIVLELRRKIKWWKLKTPWLRRMFSKLQKELELVDLKAAKSPQEIIQALQRATDIYELAKSKAYKIHKEDWYTIHE